MKTKKTSAAAPAKNKTQALRTDGASAAIKSPPVVAGNRRQKRAAGQKPRIAPRLDAYLADGRQIPEHPIKTGEPYFHQIGQEIGCSAQSLADPTKPFRAKIKAHARKHGLTPAEVSPRRRARPVEPRLLGYLEDLAHAKLRVPASVAHPDQPAWNRIGEAIDVEGWVLASARFPYRQMILDAVAARGLAPLAAVAAIAGPITLAELEAALRRDGDAGVFDDGAAKTAKQREKANDAASSALRRAAEFAADGMAGAAAPAIAAAIKSLDSQIQRRVVWELKAGMKALALIEANGLPASLAGALDFALGRCGLPRAAVARATGVAEGDLRDWASGRRAPPRGKLDKLAKIEAFLNLPKHALASRYATDARVAAAPRQRSESRRGPAGPRRSKHGPALETLFPRDWPMALDAARKPIYQRASLWPQPLRDERDDFLVFKSANIDLKRRARDKEPWSKGTLNTRDSELGRLFSFIARSFPEFAGRFGLLSFAFLNCPTLVERFIVWRSALRPWETGCGRVTTFDLALLRFCRAMFAPGGWATQAPVLALRLVALADPESEPGGAAWLIAPDAVAAAKRDWPAACARAHAGYTTLISANRKSVVIDTDHASIVAILRLDDPYVAFRLGRDGSWPKSAP